MGGRDGGGILEEGFGLGLGEGMDGAGILVVGVDDDGWGVYVARVKLNCREEELVDEAKQVKWHVHLMSFRLW